MDAPCPLHVVHPRPVGLLVLLIAGPAIACAAVGAFLGALVRPQRIYEGGIFGGVVGLIGAIVWVVVAVLSIDESAWQ